MERPGEHQFLQGEESQRSAVMVEDHSSPKTEAPFTPKITARISISMDSVAGACAPRSHESPKPGMPTIESPPRDLLSAPIAGSPRSKASPRVQDSLLLRTPSPKNENSPRDSHSPRQPLGTRLIGFFDKKGGIKFSKRRSSSCSAQSLEEQSGVNLQQQKHSNMDISPTSNEESDEHVSDKISPTKGRSSSFRIQKQKSFIGSNNAVTSTEIIYSPRQKNQMDSSNSASPRSLSRKSTDSVSKSALLLYCGNEIIAWCVSQHLSYQYHDAKDEFNITVENGGIIRVQRNNVYANTLEIAVVNQFIDLIKSLPHVENLSIYYDSQGADIDACLTSRLISSSEDTAIKKLEFT